MQADTIAELEAFVAAHGSALLRVAVGITGDRQRGEDLLQTALARCAVSWSRVRGSDHPELYVRRILVNAHLAEARKRRVVESLTGWLPDRAGPDDVARFDSRMELIPALRELGPRQRAVVVLRYYEDRTDSEIAEILGCAESTVRSQATRALDRLRDRLTDAGATVPAPEWAQP